MKRPIAVPIAVAGLFLIGWMFQFIVWGASPEGADSGGWVAVEFVWIGDGSSSDGPQVPMTEGRNVAVDLGRRPTPPCCQTAIMQWDCQVALGPAEFNWREINSPTAIIFVVGGTDTEVPSMPWYGCQVDLSSIIIRSIEPVPSVSRASTVTLAY
ncbi:MAG: hypothetical protein HYY50_04970 [Candidatus Kerfeldbacteria bacterium]|nr:hypothetical protein [Candidatus Kerfeldbacteria bacterium]